MIDQKGNKSARAATVSVRLSDIVQYPFRGLLRSMDGVVLDRVQITWNWGGRGRGGAEAKKKLKVQFISPNLLLVCREVLTMFVQYRATYVGICIIKFLYGSTTHYDHDVCTEHTCTLHFA